MPSSRKIISVIGIDGSGKSTLIRGIQTSFKHAGGVAPAYYWMRWKPTVSLPLMAAFRLTGVTRRRVVGGVTYVEKDLAQRPFLSRVWLTFLTFDVLIQALVFRMRTRKSRVVLTDRYVDDIIVDAAADVGRPQWALSKQAGLIRSFFPRSDRVIFVRTDPKVAFQRKTDVPSIDYLQARAALYELLSTANEMAVLVNPSLSDLSKFADALVLGAEK